METHSLSVMFPISLHLAGRRVLVVGHGAVGQRKAAAARAAGADVQVVDPALNAPYGPEHLDGVQLVFACAGPEVNARVAADARSRGVWVCSASDPDAGDFTLPAVVRTGALTLAISTGGAAPALARRIREKLEAEFDAAFADWVQVLEELRAEAMIAISDPKRRRELLDDFADWPWLEQLRREGTEAVRNAMRAMLCE